MGYEPHSGVGGLDSLVISAADPSPVCLWGDGSSLWTCFLISKTGSTVLTLPSPWGTVQSDEATGRASWALVLHSKSGPRQRRLSPVQPSCQTCCWPLGMQMGVCTWLCAVRPHLYQQPCGPTGDGSWERCVWILGRGGGVLRAVGVPRARARDALSSSAWISSLPAHTNTLF